MAVGQSEGRGHILQRSGGGIPAQGLQPECTKGWPSGQALGRSAHRASGPSFMEMPPLRWGMWPLLSRPPWLLSGSTLGWGRRLGRALQEGERLYDGEEGGWAVW